MDKKNFVKKMKARVEKIKLGTCLNEDGKLESVSFDAIYEAIDLMCDLVEYIEYSIKEKE